MIIATAGHIDHGKSSLVKAITGINTDRLPEEKKRGMSIDLGFAYQELENGTTLGFVDVPGHEKFVRNMLAGVTGIDYAILIVAADDGPMPQTIEHLSILDLLGVEEIINRIEQSNNESLEGVKICVELIEKYKSIEGVSGVHLMGYKQEKEIASVISNFK